MLAKLIDEKYIVYVFTEKILNNDFNWLKVLFRTFQLFFLKKQLPFKVKVFSTYTFNIFSGLIAG